MRGSDALERNKFFLRNIWNTLKTYILLSVNKTTRPFCAEKRPTCCSVLEAPLEFEREGARVVRIVWKHSFAWPISHAGGTLLSSCANLPSARSLPLSACQVCFYVCCLNPIIHDLQHSLHLFSVPQTQVTDAFLHLPLSRHFLFSTFINFQTVLGESRLNVMKSPICP